MGRARFVTMENHYNLVYREEEREMIPLCLAEGVGLIPGARWLVDFLRGTERRKKGGDGSRTDRRVCAQPLLQTSDFTVVDRLTEIATKRGVQNAQVALAWILGKPGVTAPIIGASKMTHLEQAIDGLQIQLDESEIKALEEPYEPHPVLGF